MARYIDADKLTDKLEELQFNAPVMTPVMKIYNVIELVEDQPTADVVEVKHGYWVDDGFGRGNLYCSVCKSYPVEDEDGNPLSVLVDWEPEYCPNCGAKMDGGKEE